MWLTVGLLGQLMFTARFLVQWWASEKAGRSVVPVAFWYFSILGSLIVLAYGIHKLEPVIIIGQLPGTKKHEGSGGDSDRCSGRKLDFYRLS
eukprot:gene60982-81308_t